MKILCLSWISLIICIIVAVQSENATNSSTTTSTTFTPTTDANLNETTTAESPVLTIKQYYDQILETAKRSIATFTLKFQKYAIKTIKPKENILVSMINIVGILATLLLAAEGETKGEILDVFGFAAGKNLSEKENKIHEALGALFTNFTLEANNNSATKIDVDQSIFLQNGTQITDFFRKFSQTVYKNEIVEIDFSSPTHEAADAINNWIDNRTHHRIEKLIESPVAKNTKLILTNTLFFNGEWAQPFLNETTWKPFYADDGNYSVKMMTNIGSAYILREPGRNFSALGLPYKGGNIIMFFILPNEKENLQNVLLNLTTQDLIDIATKSEKVDDLSYDVPYMNLADEIHLKNILETMGIKLLFENSRANLSNIADDIFVSHIIHKANLDVTEAGSTGSASTAVQIETKFPKEPFKVNRPFLFYVFHRSSSLISFWGTINLPVPYKTKL